MACVDGFRLVCRVCHAGARSLTVVRFSAGSSQSPVRTFVAFLSAHAWASFGPREAQEERTYSLGDVVRVELPVGNFELVVSSVEIRRTPSELTVIPTVTEIDARPTDSFYLTADLQKRVSKIERGR